MTVSDLPDLTCPHCHGARMESGEPCPYCHGAGQRMPLMREYDAVVARLVEAVGLLRGLGRTHPADWKGDCAWCDATWAEADAPDADPSPAAFIEDQGLIHRPDCAWVAAREQHAAERNADPSLTDEESVFLGLADAVLDRTAG